MASEWKEIQDKFDSHLNGFKVMSKREKIDVIVVWCDVSRIELGNYTDEQLNRLYAHVMNCQTRSVECSLM